MQAEIYLKVWVSLMRQLRVFSGVSEPGKLREQVATVSVALAIFDGRASSEYLAATGPQGSYKGTIWSERPTGLFYSAGQVFLSPHSSVRSLSDR